LSSGEKLGLFGIRKLQDLRDYFMPAFDENKFREEGEMKWIDLDNDKIVPDFNDPTFNGMLPGMTNKKLRSLFGL
jgi:hypothetical protein